MCVCVCTYCICPGNQTAALERASWEGPSGAKEEIQGNILLLKQLQQLLHVLPYAHMQACPPFLSIAHIPSATDALAQPGDKVAFNLNLCRSHSPSLTNTPHASGAFVPLTPTVPNECPALSHQKKVSLQSAHVGGLMLVPQQVLQPRGQAGECRGAEMSSQGKDFPGIPEMLSSPIDSLFPPF